jgi:hypothetical protein
MRRKCLRIVAARGVGRWAEVLAAVEQSGDNAAAIARTVSTWATRRNFRMTGAAGPSCLPFTVRADT